MWKFRCLFVLEWLTILHFYSAYSFVSITHCRQDNSEKTDAMSFLILNIAVNVNLTSFGNTKQTKMSDFSRIFLCVAVVPIAEGNCSFFGRFLNVALTILAAHVRIARRLQAMRMKWNERRELGVLGGGEGMRLWERGGEWERRWNDRSQLFFSMR